MTGYSSSSPFQHSGMNTGQLMQWLLYALLPGICASLWFFGFGLLINLILAVAVAIAAEAALLSLSNKDIRQHLADRSALVTAVLFALAIPPGSPWWLVTAGILFAVVVAKHLYGGLGQNIFNPAMCGYAMLLLAFPLQMTNWHIPNEVINEALMADSGSLPGTNPELQYSSPLSWNGLKQSLLLSFPFAAGNAQNAPQLVDALNEFKMAGHSTLLAAWESGSALFARESQTGWEIVNSCYLLGGLFLLYKRIISWHIPATIIATVLIMSVLFYAPGSTAIYGTPYLHLFGSATLLGAFFIATDPVSAATTNRGKIYYAVIIGISIYSIRVWGSYPDSIAFAVLFGNFCAPLLDHFCRPRIYGHPKAEEFPVIDSQTEHSKL